MILRHHSQCLERFLAGFLIASAAVCLPTGTTLAASLSPVYTTVFKDAVTGDNAFMHGGKRYWTIDSGADSYQNDFYERPTIQKYETINGKFATQEYFEYLDIVQAKAGFDSNYLYIAIDLYGRDNSTNDGKDTEKGLVERYGFRLSKNADGRNGLLLFADQPELKNKSNTTFGQLGTFGYRDTDGDVGGAAQIKGKGTGGPTGLNVTKSDNLQEEKGLNGYDSVIISDGNIHNTKTPVLFTRIDPKDSTIVEFAFNYKAFGFTETDLQNLPYLEFEAVKGGPKDPQKYLWNDKYTKSEAGSPYASKNNDGKSEFGTQGLGNIYELDTLRGKGIQPYYVPPTPPKKVPEPTTGIGILGFTLGALLLRRKQQ